MRTIHKYTLDYGMNTLNMPIYAKPLHIALHNNELCLWAEVETNSPESKQLFQVVYTGDPLTVDNSKYLATAITADGLVYHVYQVIQHTPPYFLPQGLL